MSEPLIVLGMQGPGWGILLVMLFGLLGLVAFLAAVVALAWFVMKLITGWGTHTGKPRTPKRHDPRVEPDYAPPPPPTQPFG